MKYTVVIERTSNNYAAYVPDLPGCVATASTREELLEEKSGRPSSFTLKACAKTAKPSRSLRPPLRWWKLP